MKVTPDTGTTQAPANVVLARHWPDWGPPSGKPPSVSASTVDGWMGDLLMVAAWLVGFVLAASDRVLDRLPKVSSSASFVCRLQLFCSRDAVAVHLWQALQEAASLAGEALMLGLSRSLADPPPLSPPPPPPLSLSTFYSTYHLTQPTKGQGIDRCSGGHPMAAAGGRGGAVHNRVYAGAAGRCKLSRSCWDLGFNGLLR
jgi:hypothetical protein